MLESKQFRKTQDNKMLPVISTKSTQDKWDNTQSEAAWPQRINIVTLELDEIELISRINAHDAEHDSDSDKPPLQQLKANTYYYTDIQGSVEESSIDAYLYALGKNPCNDSTLCARHIDEDITVVLTSHYEEDKPEDVPDNLLPGHFDLSDRDEPMLVLSLPPAQLEGMVQALRQTPCDGFELTVYLRAYNRSDDDIDHRHILIEHNSPCFVSHIDINHLPAMETEIEDQLASIKFWVMAVFACLLVGLLALFF